MAFNFHAERSILHTRPATSMRAAFEIFAAHELFLLRQYRLHRQLGYRPACRRPSDFIQD